MSARGIVAAIVLAFWIGVVVALWDGRTRDILAAILIVALAIAVGVTTTRATRNWLTRRFGK
jgi:hypothetical protein